MAAKARAQTPAQADPSQRAAETGPTGTELAGLENVTGELPRQAQAGLRGLPPGRVLQLQRLVGNRAVSRLTAGAVQRTAQSKAVTPDISSAAGQPGVVQRVTEHDGWQTEHEYTPEQSNALTPYGAIVAHYGANFLNLGALKKFLGTDQVTADIPGHSWAKKSGGPSNSDSREGGEVETMVKRLGDSEKSLKGKAGSYPYAGGHLIAYNILEGDSNDPANIAPQASALNAPVYFNLFEKVGMGTAAPVTIDVDVAYRHPEYKVQTRFLIRKGILNPSQEGRANVTIPARIPYRWDATVATEEGSGLGAYGSQTKGMKGLITTDEDEYNQEEVGQGKKSGYKVKVNSGATEEDGGLFTGGSAQTVSISAEQQDFPQNSPPPEPQDLNAPGPSMLPDAGKTKKPMSSQEDAIPKKQKTKHDGDEAEDVMDTSPLEPESVETPEIEMGESEDQEF